MVTSRRTTAAAVPVALLLAAFAALTVLVATHLGVRPVDHGVRDGFDHVQVAPLHALATIVTDLLSPGADAAVLGLGAALLAAQRSARRPFAVAAVAFLTMSAVVLAVKYGVHRVGPHGQHGGRGYYPSGHTASTLVAYGTLALLGSEPRSRRRRRLLALASALTFLVALALVYAGYHWLTDIVGSLTLGAAVLVVVSRLQP